MYDDAMENQRKAGRPRAGEQRTALVSLAARVAPSVYAAVQRAAKKRNVSASAIAAEAIARLYPAQEGDEDDRQSEQ